MISLEENDFPKVCTNAGHRKISNNSRFSERKVITDKQANIRYHGKPLD
jgi:hypothetical protein